MNLKEKTTLTIEDVLPWLQSEVSEVESKVYNYSDNRDCLMVRFAKAQGYKDVTGSTGSIAIWEEGDKLISDYKVIYLDEALAQAIPRIYKTETGNSLWVPYGHALEVLKRAANQEAQA